MTFLTSAANSSMTRSRYCAGFTMLISKSPSPSMSVRPTGLMLFAKSLSLATSAVLFPTVCGMRVFTLMVVSEVSAFLPFTRFSVAESSFSGSTRLLSPMTDSSMDLSFAAAGQHGAQCRFDFLLAGLRVARVVAHFDHEQDEVAGTLEAGARNGRALRARAGDHDFFEGFLRDRGAATNRTSARIASFVVFMFLSPQRLLRSGFRFRRARPRVPSGPSFDSLM